MRQGSLSATHRVVRYATSSSVAERLGGGRAAKDVNQPLHARRSMPECLQAPLVIDQRVRLRVVGLELGTAPRRDERKLPAISPPTAVPYVSRRLFGVWQDFRNLRRLP
jgi:hypothetical protein